MFQNKRHSGKYKVYSAVRFHDYETNLQEDLMTDIFDGLRTTLLEKKLKDFIKDYQGLSESQWKNKVLEECKNIEKTEYVAVIFHDKDKNSDGLDKSLHCHIVFKTHNLRSFRSVKDEVMLHNNRRDNFGFTVSEGGQLRYLLHISEEALKDKKHRYNISELHLFKNGEEILDPKEIEEWYSEKISQDFQSDLTPRQKQTQNELNYLNQLKQEVVSGELYPDEVYQRIEEKFDPARAVELYNSKLQKDLNTLRKTYIINKQKNNYTPRLSNIYICAPGGWGKTTLAESFTKYVLNKENKNPRDFFVADAASRQVNTIFSGYESQYISIFNEIEATVSQAQFCQYFDKWQSPKGRQVTNRNSNVTNVSRYCLFTKSDDFEIFSETIGSHNTNLKSDIDDKIWQVRRRFEAIIEVKDNYLTIYRYIEKNGKRDILAVYEAFSAEQLRNPTQQVNTFFEKLYEICNSQNP